MVARHALVGRLRFQRLDAARHRQQQYSKHHLALMRKAAISSLQTDAHYGLVCWPTSNNITTFSTAGNFAQFLRSYSRTVLAREREGASQLHYSINDIFQRFSAGEGEAGGMGFLNDSMARLLAINVDPLLIRHATKAYGEALGRGAVGGSPSPAALEAEFRGALEEGLKSFCAKVGLPYVPVPVDAAPVVPAAAEAVPAEQTAAAAQGERAAAAPAAAEGGAMEVEISPEEIAQLRAAEREDAIGMDNAFGRAAGF